MPLFAMNSLENHRKALKAEFGNRTIISPAEVAPFVMHSVGTLANQRSHGVHLLPSRKYGKKIGFDVEDVAKYLAFGSASIEETVTSDQNDVSDRRPKPLNKAVAAKTTGLTKRAWLLALKQTLDLNQQLVVCVERELLRVGKKNNDRKKIASRDVISHADTI